MAQMKRLGKGLFQRIREVVPDKTERLPIAYARDLILALCWIGLQQHGMLICAFGSILVPG